MNKKCIIAILIVFFVAILSINSVSAWWNTFECEGFSIEIPEGLEKATGYSPSTPPNHILLVSDIDNPKWDFQSLDLSEVPLDRVPDYINIVDNHTEDNLTIVKGQCEGAYPDYLDGTNITYAEFDKEGKHFYLVIDHTYRSLDKINLNEDMKLIYEVKESIKLK